MATKAQIKQWKAELQQHYPNCEPYFIDLVCDMYEKNPEYVKKASKKKFKPIEHNTPNEIIGAVSIINNPDEDMLNKYFKPPIVIKDDEDKPDKE